MIKSKTSAIFALFVLIALIASTAVSAIEYETRGNGNFTRIDQEDVLNQGSLPGLDVMWVKVNGDVVENGDEVRLSLERNEDITVKVQVMATQDVDGTVIDAEIFGDSHSIDDQSESFDAVNNTLYTKTLSLTMPDTMDTDAYDLRVTVAGRTGAVKVYNYLLRVDAAAHSVIIKDVNLNPDDSVKAGRALLAVVRVKNLGIDTEDSVKVKVSLPELGVSAVDYIEDIEKDDSVSSEELYIRIPSNAKSGTYDVNVDVEYDDGDKKVSKDLKIDVEGDGTSQPATTPSGQTTQPSDKTTITIGPQTQDLARGEGGAIYAVTLSNEGSEAKTYTVGVTGADAFAAVRISPSTLVVVNGGQTETVYVYLTAKETSAPGSYTFGVDVSSAGKSLRQIPLNANVVEPQGGEAASGSWDSAKKGLEIGLVILIVLLVILGLIIAFNKMKEDEDEDEEEEASSKTYY